MKLEYIPVKGQKEYCDMMRKFSGALDKNYPTPDYVEGTVFSKDEAVIMIGKFADVPDNERHKVDTDGIRYFVPTTLTIKAFCNYTQFYWAIELWLSVSHSDSNCAYYLKTLKKEMYCLVTHLQTPQPGK